MAGYGSKRGLIVFGTSPENQPKRDARGRFASGGELHSEITRLNEAVAKTFQAHLVETVARMPLRRPSVSSGRLVRAMGNTDNRFADAFGWGVGNIAYLDGSVAKYWRTIEEGSVKTWKRGGMRGMEIFGVWGGSITGYHQSRWGLVPRAGGPWRNAVPNGTGKLRGFNRRFAEQKGITPMIVENEIQAHHYFAEARETYNPTREWARGVEDILRRSTRTPLNRGYGRPTTFD